MKTLLLGPNGQLGTDIRSANEKRNLLDIISIDRASVDLAQIDEAIEYLRKIDFDLLINCTGYHQTDEVETNEPLAVTINTQLVGELARLCEQKRARFVHVSTDYVFGGQETRVPLAESASKAPLNIYGRSKSDGEDLAITRHDDVLVLRVASLFGVAGASGKGGNFVETMIRFGKEKGKLHVVNDQFMSPTATRDVADAMLTLIERRVEPGIYHVVNNGAASWYDFARRIIERANINASVEGISTAEYPTLARRPPFSVLDNRKTAYVIGELSSWEEALDRYLVSKGHRT